MQELSLHLMDIAQNSIVAGAKSIRILIDADKAADKLSIRIVDDGRGMSEEMLARVTSPFATTRVTRKVGLGVPMFKQGAEATGGSFSIDSKLGVGTDVCAVYGFSHIDRAPMGDLAGTIIALIVGNPDLDFEFSLCVDGERYEFNTAEVRAALGGDVPLTTPEVVGWIRSDIIEGINALKGGAF